MANLSVNIYNVRTPEGMKDYVTFLPYEYVFANGLVPEAIIGQLLRPLQPGEQISPAIFARNRIFVDFMHSVITRHAPNSDDFIAEARHQQDGYVYIIDQRTKTPQGTVPPEDIVGRFSVKDGVCVAASYEQNQAHKILSDTGFFQLGMELQACLLDELMKLRKMV